MICAAFICHFVFLCMVNGGCVHLVAKQLWGSPSHVWINQSEKLLLISKYRVFECFQSIVSDLIMGDCSKSLLPCLIEIWFVLRMPWKHTRRHMPYIWLRQWLQVIGYITSSFFVTKKQVRCYYSVRESKLNEVKIMMIGGRLPKDKD